MRMYQMFQVDAFTEKLFQGNPAAVVPLDTWLADGTMQAIAEENNLSETAFFVKEGEGYHLRWFTPDCEVDLCGHATLASSHVIFEFLNYQGDEITFQSRSGPLRVKRHADAYTLDFPQHLATPFEKTPALMVEGLGVEPLEAYDGFYMLAVFAKASDVANIKPDFNKLAELGGQGVICTAPADAESGLDFVSRFFCPMLGGGDEDPVTGSAHCLLTPYWGKRFDKTAMNARQISKRGGNLLCEWKGERVHLTGRARLYMKGEFYLDESAV